MAEETKNESESLETTETEIKTEEGCDGPGDVSTVSTESKAIKNEEEAKRKARERILRDEMKFMADFDESKSLRIQKKNRRRYYHADGRLMIQAEDFNDCDCLNPKCPGCHYPCKNCSDTRCGHECRINRRWVYESLEVEGWNPRTVKNQHLENLENYEGLN